MIGFVELIEWVCDIVMLHIRKREGEAVHFVCLCTVCQFPETDKTVHRAHATQRNAHGHCHCHVIAPQHYYYNAARQWVVGYMLSVGARAACCVCRFAGANAVINWLIHCEMCEAICAPQQPVDVRTFAACQRFHVNSWRVTRTRFFAHATVRMEYVEDFMCWLWLDFGLKNALIGMDFNQKVIKWNYAADRKCNGWP